MGLHIVLGDALAELVPDAEAELGTDVSLGGTSVIEPKDTAAKTVEWEELEPTGPVAWE